MMRYSEIKFISHGAICSGRCYKPANASAQNLPVVIMAHGLGGLMDLGLYKYASAFQEVGWKVVMFDYRTYGESEGLPRNWASPGRQLEDWQAAIDWVKDQAFTDVRHVVLWGSSYSGGHVMEMAARNPWIAGVICQVPMLDGKMAAEAYPSNLKLKALSWAICDRIRSLFMNKPCYMQLVGEPGEFAILVGPGARHAYEDAVPPGSKWKNLIAARFCLENAYYRPIARAAQVKCPFFLLDAEYDNLVPRESILQARKILPNPTFFSLPVEHFDVYKEPHIQKAIKNEVLFLDRIYDSG